MGTDRQFEVLAEALLQQMTYVAQHSSRTAEMLAVGVMNNVLEVGTRTFDAAGTVQLNWGTTCGSIEVVNHGTTPVFVGSGPPSSSSPNLPRVDAGIIRAINVGSRVVTLYGTAGATVGFQAYTVGASPRNSIVAIDGGTP